MTDDALNYSERSARADAEYERIYREELAKLPKSERAKFVELGLEAPHVDAFAHDRPIAGGSDDDDKQDPAEWNAASETIDFAAGIDKLDHQLRERFGLSAEQASAIAEWHQAEMLRAIQTRVAFMLQRVVAGFLAPGNVKLRAYGLAIASKLDCLNGIPSQRFVARKLHVSPASVSTSVNYWIDALEMPRNEYTKDEEARDTYSEERKRNHWRHQKCKD